jgi:pyruvate dehydrogenase E2 component (dihydrolipoamide acetyltransferase)
MAYRVIVPRESEEMESCQIVVWHVRRGERVEAGDPLCEVDTGKATFDIEAPAAGVVLEILYNTGEEAPLLTPLAVIGEPGEEYDTDTRRSDDDTGQAGIRILESQTRSRREAGGGDMTTREAAAREKSHGEAQAGEEPAGEGPAGKKEPVQSASEAQARVSSRGLGSPASPRARRLAERNGVNLRSVTGSGPDGAIVERDVRRYLSTLRHHHT